MSDISARSSGHTCVLIVVLACLALATARVEAHIGMAAQNDDRRVVVFDTETNTVLGWVSIPVLLSGPTLGDCSISRDETRGYVTDFRGSVWVIDLTTSPPSLALGHNPIFIANNGEDTDFSPDGRYLVVSDGRAVQPVSVIDVEQRMQVDAMSLGSDATSVAVCEDASVLVTSYNLGTVRRLTLDAFGHLADTGEVLALPTASNVYCAPGAATGFAIGGADLVRSFTIPGLAPLDTRAIGGDSICGVITAAGDRVVARSTGAVSAVKGFAYDRFTGMFGASQFDIPVSQAPNFQGMDQIAFDPSSSRLYVSVVNGVAVYDAASGSHLTTMVIGNSTGICFAAPADAPIAVAAAAEHVECTSPAGGTVILDGSGSSDSESAPGTNQGIVAYEWFEDFGLPGERLLDTGEVASVVLPLGAHTITLRVTNVFGLTATDTLTVTVQDTVAPEVQVVLSPDQLWPPNHRMIGITASVAVLDLCSTSTVALVSVESSEPDDGDGDGDTVDDIQGADIGEADFTFDLRAERRTGGDGRIYSVTYSAADAAGNTTAATGYVLVPHDRGGSVDPLSLAVDASLDGIVISWDAAPDADFYNVIRGRVADISRAGSFIVLGPVVCIEAESLDTTTAEVPDAEDPGSGEVFFYLVEYNNGLASGYGTESAGAPAVPGSGGCGP